MNRISIIVAAAAALGLTAVAAPAASARTEVEGVMIVRVGDLNTSSREGAQSALRRIRAAAQQFCGEPTRDLGRHFAEQRCVHRMTGKAVASLNAPLVTALYTGQTSIQLAQAQSQR
jgi:UrcA family protein